MAYCPTPILIVSSSTNRGEIFKTYDALAAGAVDVLEKPGAMELDGEWERRLIAAVKMVSKIKVITHPRARLKQGRGREPSPAGRAGYRLVAVGASTGGPAALAHILSRLPADFPLPILVVLHISRLFGPGFADWLGHQSPLPVAFAEDGQLMPEAGVGRVILAPPDRHLVLQGRVLRLTETPERHSCRPSVDCLFESVAR
jgi:two-component system chemotaxis response regulator CheB